jgi:hypothetical protein
MSLIQAVLLSATIACSAPEQWADITDIVDPALPLLARDYAAVVLDKKSQDFQYKSIKSNGKEVMFLLYYMDNNRYHSFNVFIDANTWERTHEPEE